MKARHHLAARYCATHPAEAARRLEAIPAAEVAVLLAEIDPGVAAEVVAGMQPSSAAAVLEPVNREVLATILKQLPAAHCVLILRSVDRARREAMVSLLPRAAMPKVRRLLRVSPGSAGFLAEPIPAMLSPDMSLAEARTALEGTSTANGYVVDGGHRLVGVVHRKVLAKREDRARIGSLMTRRLISLPEEASIHAIRHHRAWLELDALPVVDASGVLVGVLRHRSLRQATHRQPSTSAGPGSRAAIEALLDLGELYWGGLTSVLGALGPGQPEPGAVKAEAAEVSRDRG